MSVKLSNRHLADPILPPVSPAVQRRLLAAVHHIGAPIGHPNDSNPEFHGCVLLPFANIVLAGTACARPQLFAECDALARATGHDLIILRYDALRGTTFDIKLGTEPRWFRRYLARPVEVGLQMAPDCGAGPVLWATAFGIGTAENRAARNTHPLMALPTAPSQPLKA